MLHPRALCSSNKFFIVGSPVSHIFVDPFHILLKMHKGVGHKSVKGIEKGLMGLLMLELGLELNGSTEPGLRLSPCTQNGQGCWSGPETGER